MTVPEWAGASAIVDVGLGIVVRRNPDDVSCSEYGRVSVLITKRRSDAVYPGWWELPGGKVEAGETPDACVVRELREETGLLVRVLGPLGGVGDLVHEYPHATVRLHPRLCVLRGDSPPPANLLVADHRWVPADRLPEHQFPEANAPVIQVLGDWMNNGAARVIHEAERRGVTLPDRRRKAPARET